MISFTYFESIDIEKSPHVFALLDEGCNSACHSSSWAAEAEKKLARFGYTMPLKDDGGGSFAGLGSGSTKTEGTRSIPFSLMLKTDKLNKLNGVLDSHQLTSGNSPLLLSLHAQTKLGLVKDLKNGIISISGEQLKVYRCHKTGLFMMNLTKGLIPITPGSSVDIPKAHRPLRAMVAVDSGALSTVGFHSNERHEVQRELDRAISSETKVVIVTRGKRFGQEPLDPKGRRHIIKDVEHLHDPGRDPSMQIHVGWVPGITERMIRFADFNSVLNETQDEIDSCDNPEGILVEIRCKPGRHRSVAAGFCGYHQALRRGKTATLVHYNSPDWVTMKCGGTCTACRDHQWALSRISPILPKRHKGPILAPVRPEARDVRDRAEEVRDDPGRAIPDDSVVTIADSSSVSSADLAGLVKSMKELSNRVDDLRDQVVAAKAKDVKEPELRKSRRSRSRKRSRSLSPRRARRKLPSPPHRPPSVPRRRRDSRSLVREVRSYSVRTISSTRTLIPPPPALRPRSPSRSLVQSFLKGDKGCLFKNVP